MKTIHIITLFPELVESYANESIVKRAQEKKILKVVAVNPRDFATDRHRTVDDRPYGGGPGMVLKAEPILKAVEAALRRGREAGGVVQKGLTSKRSTPKNRILVMSPRGKQFTNAMAAKLARGNMSLVLVAGHYEGIDARVKKILKAEEISVGPYVLTGGELPALTIVDAVARQIKGVLGKRESLEERRTAAGEMYTRPEILTWKKKRYAVPSVLKSGHHAEIEEWKRKQIKKKKPKR